MGSHGRPRPDPPSPRRHRARGRDRGLRHACQTSPRTPVRRCAGPAMTWSPPGPGPPGRRPTVRPLNRPSEWPERPGGVGDRAGSVNRRASPSRNSDVDVRSARWLAASRQRADHRHSRSSDGIDRLELNTVMDGSGAALGRSRWWQGGAAGIAQTSSFPSGRVAPAAPRVCPFSRRCVGLGSSGCSPARTGSSTSSMVRGSPAPRLRPPEPRRPLRHPGHPRVTVAIRPPRPTASATPRPDRHLLDRLTRTSGPPSARLRGDGRGRLPDEGRSSANGRPFRTAGFPARGPRGGEERLRKLEAMLGPTRTRCQACSPPGVLKEGPALVDPTGTRSSNVRYRKLEIATMV